MNNFKKGDKVIYSGSMYEVTDVFDELVHILFYIRGTSESLNRNLCYKVLIKNLKRLVPVIPQEPKYKIGQCVYRDKSEMIVTGISYYYDYSVGSHQPMYICHPVGYWIYEKELARVYSKSKIWRSLSEV